MRVVRLTGTAGHDDHMVPRLNQSGDEVAPDVAGSTDNDNAQCWSPILVRALGCSIDHRRSVVDRRPGVTSAPGATVSVEWARQRPASGRVRSSRQRRLSHDTGHANRGAGSHRTGSHPPRLRHRPAQRSRQRALGGTAELGTGLGNQLHRHRQRLRPGLGEPGRGADRQAYLGTSLRVLPGHQVRLPSRRRRAHMDEGERISRTAREPGAAADGLRGRDAVPQSIRGGV